MMVILSDVWLDIPKVVSPSLLLTLDPLASRLLVMSLLPVALR